jgi:isoleucyl-tRNA synthetase
VSPLLPLLSEEIYRGLTGERSVHLTDWPDVSDWPEDEQLLRQMDRVREVCSAALALRRSQDVRVRQPLRRLTIAGPDLEELEPFGELIRDEVNVKEVVFEPDVEQYASVRLQVNSRLLGKRLGKKMQGVIKAAKAGEWTAKGDGVEVAGESLSGEDYTIKLDPRDGVMCQALASNDAIAILDLEIDEELSQEGRARDLVRLVQQARREADLHVSDRIHVVLELAPQWRDAAANFRDYIAGQTLAQTLELEAGLPTEGYFVHEAQLGRDSIKIALARV